MMSSGGLDPSLPRADDVFEDAFKVITIGDPEVGKTCLILRYTTDTYRPNLINTIGVDLKVKNIVCEGKKYVMKIWDTAGQERYKSIRGTFFRGATGAIIVYDISQPQSFASVPRWLEDLETNTSSQKQPVVMLVGNKIDRSSERRVSRLKAEELALSYKMKYFEVSAKSGEGVERAFESFRDDLIANSQRSKMESQEPRRPTFTRIRVGEPSSSSPRSQGCRCN